MQLLNDVSGKSRNRLFDSNLYVQINPNKEQINSCKSSTHDSGVIRRVANNQTTSKIVPK